MNENPETEQPATSPALEQSAFVSGLLERQDEVLDGLSVLANRIDAVIDAITQSTHQLLAAAEDGSVDELGSTEIQTVEMPTVADESMGQLLPKAA